MFTPNIIMFNKAILTYHSNTEVFIQKTREILGGFKNRLENTEKNYYYDTEELTVSL